MTTTLKATAGVRWYTIFDEPLALWASKLLQSNELLQSDGGHVLTWPQVLQLRLHLRKKDFYNVLVPEGLLENRLHTGAACATLIHSQRCHIVNQNRGDVPVSVDFTAAALSMRGTQLTDDKASMEAVEALAQEKGYSSPFWLTLEEAEYFISGSWWLQRRLNCSTAAFASAYAQKKDICSVPVINDCGQSSQVVNLCEFPRINEVELGHRHHISALSAFRQFVPHNVFTGCPFSQKLQDAIRHHCLRYNCWCSVWGTVDDFAQAGAAALDGALGLWTVDELDLPMFLTSALCCVDMAAAFSRVYPKDIVRLTG